MPSREHREALSRLSSDIRAYVLANNLGMIPDPEEDYLSILAIARILGREETTIENKLPSRLIERHPLGPYFRLSVAIEVMSGNKEKQK